jgi:hypothetical protein
MNKYLISVLFVLLVLIGGVFAATIDTPETEVLQGQSWGIRLDCPNMGSPGDVCLVEWTGPDSGSFIEQDSGSDPDWVNKYQSLDTPGNYIYTIKECPTGAPASCGAVEDSFSMTVKPIPTDDNTATIWVKYYSSAEFIRVSGIAPSDTNRIEVVVWDKDQLPLAPPIKVFLTPDVHRNYGSSISLTGITPKQILNIKSTFIDDANAILRTATTVFEAYHLEGLQEQVDQLEIDVFDLNIAMNDQNLRINDLEQQVIDLNAQDANFANQLAVVNTRLAEHDQNIIDLQAQIDVLDQNVIDIANDLSDVNAALNLRIDDLNAEMLAHVANLQAQIDALDVRVTDLENMVARMNHGTMSLAYDRAGDLLRVKGEAPEGAANIEIQIRDLDRDTIYTYTTTVNVSDNSFAENISGVNSWDPQVYDVRVIFKDSGNVKIGQSVVEQFYALAYVEDFQGFGFVENETFEYFLVLPSERAMAFNFGAVTEGQYDFNLILSNGTSTNEFLLSSHIAKYNGQEFNTLFDIPGKGMYAASLVAYNQTTGVTTTSNDFNIEIVDLFDSISGQIVVNSPANNDNAYSVQASTFYTNRDFNLVGVVNGVALGVKCNYSLFDGHNLETVKTTLLKNNSCWTMMFESGVLGDTEGLFRILLDNDVNNITPADFNLGIDYTKPQFPDLNTQAIIPSVGSYSGVLHVDVNTWDVISGVSTVLIDLMDKNTGAVVSSAFASYNAGTIWDHDFNTILLGIPDGNYDIKATVTDVAGNVDDRIVDPGIDNTKPVINAITVTTNPMLRNTVVTLDVNVTDNFAGVKEVKAVVTDGTTTENVELSLASGTVLDGIWSVDFNVDATWTLGTYTVTVDANDYAIPSNEAITKTSSAKVLKNYYFNIDTGRTITSGGSTSFDGNFRDALGSAGPFADENVILITGSAVSDANVEFDGNGFYKISTKSLSTGTYYIDLNYNTPDYNYIEQIVLKVNTPTTPGGSPGGGGSPPAKKAPLDTNEPEEPEVPEEPAAPTDGEGTGGETGGDTGPGDETTGDTTPPALSPATGLFGLGDVTPIATGLIALILIVVGAIIVKKKMK